MADFLFANQYFCVALTVIAYAIGGALQKKWRLAIFNPILIGAGIVMAVLSMLKVPNATYQAGCTVLNYLLTPATICLAIAFYEQFQAMRSHMAAIFLGVLAGTVCCLGTISILCAVFGFDRVLTLSMLPKSITTAIGVPLCEEIGGISAVTIAAIAITGILGYIAGPTFCKIFKIKDPIAQGVAFGVATHVTGTTKAYELSQLIGAVGSFSLTLAGLITTAILSILAQFL